MTLLKLSVVALAGAFFLAGAQAPAFAASPVTEAFLKNLDPNVDFLDRSSRFALTNSKEPGLRDFAHSEAREQTMVANALYDWIKIDTSPLVASTAVPGVQVTKADHFLTGRSVAIDTPAPQPVVAAPQADNRLVLGQEDLDSLEGLEGASLRRTSTRSSSSMR